MWRPPAFVIFSMEPPSHQPCQLAPVEQVIGPSAQESDEHDKTAIAQEIDRIYPFSLDNSGIKDDRFGFHSQAVNVRADKKERSSGDDGE